MKVLKFLSAGLLTALLDNGIFFVLHRATGARFLSLAVATAVSVIFNYLVVRTFIFETKVDHSSALPKYLGVHTAGLMARWGLLESIIALFHFGPKHWGIYAAKLAADAVVYSLKYVIQRDFVFKPTTGPLAEGRSPEGAVTHTAAPKSDRSCSPAAPESIPPMPQPQSESLL